MADRCALPLCVLPVGHDGAHSGPIDLGVPFCVPCGVYHAESLSCEDAQKSLRERRARDRDADTRTAPVTREELRPVVDRLALLESQVRSLQVAQPKGIEGVAMALSPNEVDRAKELFDSLARDRAFNALKEAARQCVIRAERADNSSSRIVLSYGTFGALKDAYDQAEKL